MNRGEPVSEVYDRIGRSYNRTRRADPRIAAQIADGLGGARTVVNVGAGTGSYEPTDRDVVAVDPSAEMLRQRAAGSAPAVRGVAEALPFADEQFDAALAVLTVHHWTDAAAGLRELRRVSSRQVVFFYEPLQTHGFWGLEYFPEAKELPSELAPPDEVLLRTHLEVREVQTLLVPDDCVDGFGAAFWSRPEAYLDPEVQAGMSWLALLPSAARARGTARLRDELASGEWDRRHGHLRGERELDAGYRLAVAGTVGP